jgi:hypothetical protein
MLRTSLAYISYGEKLLKEGILSCFTKIPRGKSYYYQGARCYPRYGEEDMSRDQTILALSALKFNGDTAELREIGPKLRYRLSKRFIMTPALWLWIRLLCTDKKIYNTLFGIMEVIELLPSVLWNKMIRPILRYNREFSMDWYMSIDPTTGLWHNWDGKGWVFDEKVDWANNGYKVYALNEKRLYDNKFLDLLDKAEFPEYASHLASWMIHFMHDGFLKRILKKLMLWNVEKENYLLRMLVGEKQPVGKLVDWKPTHWFRWSTRLNGTSYYDYLTGDDATYNTIDRDILLPVLRTLDPKLKQKSL